ncbi:MAG: alpha-glucosidase [Clostridiaceae bacterium]|nr:alpha-glucosidase [Clostridiaceae bacterium]
MKVYEIKQYVTKYTIGQPFATEAVMQEGKPIQKKQIDYFQVEEKEELCLKYKMDSEDIVWGLGENQRGMNKRGGVYESYCSDDPNHTPDKKSLYGAHNFFIMDGEVGFGVFIDYPGKVTFDVGFTHKDILEITIGTTDVDIYIIKGENAREITREFLAILGEGYAPPKWAFGYQQSRWSYRDAQEVEKVAEDLLYNRIPCDSIYLDIDYMEDYKDFTISKENFPNFRDFVNRMKQKGFRLIPIIDAGVKIEEGYDVYEEGIANNYFCLDKKGKPFVAAVWPGKVHFPDFLNPEARKWFGLKYKDLINDGIEGFWNDMNEPAIFYTEEGLKEAIETAETSKNKNLDIHSFFHLMDSFRGISNSLKDYQSFYHRVEGELVNHHELHNLYGYNMTRAAAEGFEEIDPNKRFLLFSRASYIGMHRYGGIWTGDNHSWWQHLLLNIKMMPSLNMCGFLYSGADTGGFSGEVNQQLMIRWTQFSIFTPLFRNHSAMGTRRQEPFAFDGETIEVLRSTIELRYKLIPYIYSEYMKALLKKDVYFQPLAFQYPDERSRRVEDQLLVGETLMIAPLYEENAIGRYVWLPEEMLLWGVHKNHEGNYRVMEKGDHYLEVALEETPIFIRKNKMLVLGKTGLNVEALDHRELQMIAFVDTKASYIYYDDDGKTKEFRNGNYTEIIVEIEKVGEIFKIKAENRGNRTVEKLHVEVIDTRGNRRKQTIDVIHD